MNIRLKPDTEEWLKAQVAEGRFESVEEVVEVLVEESRSNQAALDSADLSWAKPYLEKGLAAIEAGDLIPAEEVHEELLALLKRPKRS
jgi:predicted transcriptional regulator